MPMKKKRVIRPYKGQRKDKTSKSFSLPIALCKAAMREAARRKVSFAALQVVALERELSQ